jgi:hypothetical protein
METAGSTIIVDCGVKLGWIERRILTAGTADRWVRCWTGEAYQQVMGWIVGLDADLKKAGYSGNLRSEK